MHFRLLVLLAALGVSRTAVAQNGDRPNDDPQVASELSLRLPPAKALSPEDELKTFHVPAGFRLELVAAEPLVHDPVAVAFDLQGNLWVAEMSGYNADILKSLPALATPEAKTWLSGKIVKLEDTDGDGRMDRRTVFLDDLDSPRALAIVRGGVLVADPPYVWFARDRDGDGKCDERTVIADDYGPKGNGEGAANGLLWGRDNRIHNVSYGYDFQRRGDDWTRSPIPIRGQFGISQDDFGRLFFNRNSDQLRGDTFAPRYAARNPHVSDLPWINTLVAKDQRVWPGHPTPGVNRGYRKGFLRDDGSLYEFTAACSPQIYRGANFPAEYYGNAFIPEPAANVIKRNLLSEHEGQIVARNAYDGREFLFSTDERFRPVALANTPQGDLYVVDMYRGILQEVRLITTYLRKQALRRGLEAPMFGLGRIWRLRYAGGPVETRKPALAEAKSEELVALLNHASAWWRDTAQQALVERGDRSVVPALQELARAAAEPRTRVAALWSLEGLGALDLGLLADRRGDASPQVRAAAVRLHEQFLHGDEAEAAVSDLAKFAADPAPEVIVQVALTLGDGSTDSALALMEKILFAGPRHPYLPKAIASGLAGRELAFYRRVAARARDPGAEAAAGPMLNVLAGAMARAGNPADISELLMSLSDAGGLPEPARLAALDGFNVLTRPAVRREIPPARLFKASALQPLRGSASAAVQARVAKLQGALGRLEKAQAATERAAVTLTPEEMKRADAGKATFQLCAACHQPTGTGLPGLAPSLVDSPWVRGNPAVLVRILMNGKEGTPGFPSAMPPVAAALSDQQIADVLTYVRNSWGLHAGPVSPETVAAVRKVAAGRGSAWTDKDLARVAAKLGGGAQ